MNRRKFIAGNWKMNTTLDTGTSLARGLLETIGDVGEVDVALFVPSVYLSAITEVVTSSPISTGAQNMYYEDSGAFTGEISATMIRDCGCKYVLLGHSERRHVFGETDEMVNKKVLKALDSGLEVVLAVGELLEERDAGDTLKVNERQIRQGLAGVTEDQMGVITIAYEPVWAIGTGRTATPDQAQEVHAFIRSVLSSMYNDNIAAATRIQYGGSVKPGNAAELFSQEDIDGGLIGGASLSVEDFTAIVRAGM